MQEYVGKIKAYLEDCRLKKFTGGMKMAFEKGIPKTFWKSTNPEFKINPIDDSFVIDKELAMATAGTFSGSLFFILEDGIIKNYDNTETLQGRELLEKLDNINTAVSAQRGPDKRPVLAVRKKATI